MVARLLNMMGMYFAPEGVSTGANQENPKGFWERRDVRALNDMVLHSAGADWHRLSDFSLENVPASSLAKFKVEGAKIILDLDAHRPWFLKEPRFCLLAPLWLELLEFPVCVLVHRSPLEVAESLATRNEVPISFGLALWERYNTAALNATRGHRRIQISHSDLVADPVRVVRQLQKNLDDAGVRGLRAPSDEEIRAFVDPALYRAKAKQSRARLSPVQRKLRDAFEKRTVLISKKDIQFSAESQEVLKQHDQWIAAQEKVAQLEEQNAILVAESSDLKSKLEQSQKGLREAQVTITQGRQELEQSRKLAGESQKEAHKLKQELEQSRKLAGESQKEAHKSKQELEQSRKLAGESQKEAHKLKQELEQSRKLAGESQKEAHKLKQELEQSRKLAGESQREAFKLKATISEHAATAARYQLQIKKLREILSQAGGLLERALTSSRWRYGSLLLFRSRKFAGETDPHWRKRLLGEFKAWVQKGGDSPDDHSAKDRTVPVSVRVTTASEQSNKKPVLGDTGSHSVAMKLPGPKDTKDNRPESEYVPRYDGEPVRDAPVKTIAFYLPQYHSIPENDAFWGEGFTDWTNVRTGKPQFAGHYQPHIPDELGYYDLLDPAVQRRQVEIAKLYGVGGFCFYTYWFDGKRLLEKPLDNYLQNTELDLPFCLCWANENWTRRWDGREKDILVAQNHSAEDDLAFIEHIAKYLRDPRYIRIDEKPLLLVYRPNLLPVAMETVTRWREWCRSNGIGELYLAYTQSFERVNPSSYGFDAAIEFHPNMKAKSFELPNLSKSVATLRDDFSGEVLDWRTFVDESHEYVSPEYKLFRAVCPSWDNTARKKNSSRILLNSSPGGYHEWLGNVIKDTCERFQNPDERLVFVNAWNEWAEGAHLEPDARYGYAHLEATRLALSGAAYEPISKDGSAWKSGYFQGRLEIAKGKPVVLLCAHSCGHQLFGAERSFVDILDALVSIGLNTIVSLPRTANRQYLDAIRERSAGVYILSYRQWDQSPEDEAVIESFVRIIQHHKVNVVHANTIMLREPLSAARRCGITTIIHAREVISHDQALAKQIGLSPEEIIAEVIAAPDFIIANSEATAECFKRTKPVRIVPNAVDANELDLPNVVDPVEVRFAMVSHNHRKKGLSDFLDLARRCEGLVPNARFLLFGRETPEVTELVNDQRGGRAPGNIDVMGYRKTPREVMAQANVILNLSHFGESFGRTAAEAMAARRPVIAYNWGALPELIQHGQTGYLVSYRSLEELTARVKELCENPRVIPEMGRKGRLIVEDRYSPRVLLERLKEVYSDVLSVASSAINGPANLCNVELLRSAPPTAIIIAVHNAYEEVCQCIRSLVDHTNLTENRLIVIDDASTDARIPKFIKDQMQVEYIRNEQNIGYTKTCNKGIGLAESFDVVLLNSDTIVTPRWLESLRIAAYSAPAVGTATALSDNAGAFSFPVPNQQNPKPDGISHADFARCMRHFCGGALIPSVPTGNGFCLFIRRELISQIGSFDEEAFPRGYGEENDFCMRAMNAGWRNVIAPGAFVFHRRNASFQGEKERLLTEGIEIITKRYPDYARSVRDAFSHPDMESLRASARRAAAATALTTSVETRVAVCTNAAPISQAGDAEGERRFVAVCSPNQILLPKGDSMIGNGEAQVSLTKNCACEFGTWLLRCGIDRVEADLPDNNLHFDPTEVCRLFGIPISTCSSENFRKQESGDQMEELRAYLRCQSQEEWLAILADPKRALEEFRSLIPRLPSDEIQFSTARKTGLVAIQEAFDFVEVAKERFVSLGGGVLEDARVLDFGCGWGRITRLFLRDIKPKNLVGVDARENIVATAQELAPKLNFHRIDPYPPLECFPEATVDIVVAYSVFSHLSEEAAQQWLTEFARIIRPGGIACITSRPRAHLVNARALAGREDVNRHRRAYVNMLPDIDQALRDYDSGKFVFVPTGGGGVLSKSFYGEAIIPASYVEKNWADKFIFREWVSDYSRIASQPIIVLQRKASDVSAIGDS